MKITSRDVKAFLLGMLALFLIEIALDWNNHIESFKKGFDKGYEDARDK